MKNFQEFKKEHSIEKEITCFNKNDISRVMVPHVATGISELDALLGGGLTAGVIMLGGHSGMGKSTLALQIAENISAQNVPVFYYSLEMSKIAITAKALSRQIYKQTGGEMSITSGELLHRGNVEGFSNEMWEEINKAREAVRERCQNLLIIEDRKNNAISGLKIYKDVTQYAKKGNAVVFVDYLQFLSAELEQAEASRMGMMDPRNAIDMNIRYLRQLASEMNIPVVVINSLNRSSYGKSIGASAFKESGTIEYTADVVLSMQFGVFSDNGELKNGERIADQEKSKMPRIVDLIALKQRYGRSGERAKVRFHYYSENDFFRAIANYTPISVSNSITKNDNRVQSQTVNIDPDYDTSWLNNCD